MAKSLPIVILAGGLGARMGGNKPHKLLAGLSLLDHAIAKAASFSAPVAASVSVGNFPLPDHVSRLIDEEPLLGPIAGLATALKFASAINADHVMIMPCDTPFLPDDLAQRLVDNIGTSRVAIAQYDGWPHPTCSLWRADAAVLLPDYLAAGMRSLIGFCETAGSVAVDFPKNAVDPFLNINTSEDLKRAEQIYARRQKEN